MTIHDFPISLLTSDSSNNRKDIYAYWSQTQQGFCLLPENYQKILPVVFMFCQVLRLLPLYCASLKENDQINPVSDPITTHNKIQSSHLEMTWTDNLTSVCVWKHCIYLQTLKLIKFWSLIYLSIRLFSSSI